MLSMESYYMKGLGAISKRAPLLKKGVNVAAPFSKNSKRRG
jgi:hypothetical protein